MPEEKKSSVIRVGKVANEHTGDRTETEWWGQSEDKTKDPIITSK